MRYYVAIEKSVNDFERYVNLWAKYGIIGIRADSITEGIEKANKVENSPTDELYFISITTDDIDYMPALKVLSDKTNSPILIASSIYDEDERQEALHRGADYYGQYCDTDEKNIEAVIAYVTSFERRMEKAKPKSKLMVYKGLLVSEDFVQVFADNTEISLTKREFDVLCFLMKNQGNTLTYERILNEVWGDNNATSDVLRTHIKQIRKKIAEVLPHYETIIENAHGIGYRFTY